MCCEKVPQTSHHAPPDHSFCSSPQQILYFCYFVTYSCSKHGHLCHISRVHLRPFTKQPTGRAVGLRPTVFCLPCPMSLHQQGFDRIPVLAGAEFLVSQTVPD